jgi:hypothetical protein
MFTGVTLSLNNYDALLNGWANQTIKTFVVFNGGNSKYTILGENARNNTLIGIYNWTITDGGKSVGSAPVMVNSTILPLVAYANDTLLGYCVANNTFNDTIQYNYTWYLENVTNSSGIINTTLCYQESANTTNQTGVDGSCGLNYDGQYQFTGTIDGIQYGNLSYDGNWSSFAMGVQGSTDIHLYINYTFASHSKTNSKWRVKALNQDSNFSIPSSCWNNTDEILKFDINIKSNGSVAGYNLSMTCMGTNWTNIYNNTGVFGSSYDAIFEEAMYWNVSNPAVQRNLTKGQNWILQCIAYNGILYSAGLNSSVRTINNSLPVMVSANITPLLAYSNSTLGGVCVGTDVDIGDTFQYYYKWYNNTILQSSGFGSTITNETNYHNVGDQWNLSCIANDGTDNSSILYSNTVTILDYPPVTHTARISPNLSYINTTLNGYCNVSHYDNTSFNISYAWYKNQSICYQESANTTNQTGRDGNCALQYTGVYSCDSNVTNCTNVNDGNYSTNAYRVFAFDPGYIYINYTKPLNYDYNYGARWALNSSIGNVSVLITNACLQQSNLKLRLALIDTHVFVDVSRVEGDCWNGTTWENLIYYSYGAHGFGSINEESISWNPTAVLVKNGTYINGTNYGETNVNNHTLNNSDYGYNYFLSCNGYNSNGIGNTVYSTSQRVNDIITYSNGTDDSTSIFPEIGDVINLYVNITNRDFTGTCRLVVNDTGTWRYPTNYINTILVDTSNISNYNLPFTFYVTTNSTYIRENVTWKVECNDSHSTTFNNNVSNFTVRDVTYPVINITANSFNINTNNVTVVSGFFYNLTYNITYDDPNLFAMEVNVTCNKNGTVYYFTNVSLNPVQSYNKYDTLMLNNISVQNCTFYTAVSDDHTAKEIPVYQSEQLVNGISYLTENKNLIQITAETPNTVLLSKQISGTVIETGGIKGEGTIKEDGGNIEVNTYTSVQTEKLIDRETFAFKYNDYSTTRQFIVRADNPIYYIEGSNYPAHFVVWNAEEFKGNWIDFSDTINQGNEYSVEKINDYEYAVTITTLQPKNELQFSSIGGTLITNFSFTFYIGGTIFLNSNNTANGTPFSNYSYNLQYIDSFPPMNSTGTVPSNNASIQNISEGNYTLYLTHSCFFPQTTTVNVNNLSINISYDSYQSEHMLLFKHVQTLLPLTNITYNITGLGTDIDGNTGTSSNLTLHLNAGIYNISWTSPGYSNMSQNITTTCLENTTTTLYTSYFATFNLFDEKLSTLTGSNVVFNLSGATSVSFLLFCPGITLSEIVNSTNFTTTISCPYLSFQFLLSYGTTSYYRSFILDPSVTNDYPIYLIDQLTTAYLFNGLVADDLLNKYIRPRIFVLKTIGNRTVQITADFADIEQKIGAFLIENHKYIIQILSDNLPIYTIGDYAADLSGTKNIRLYQVGLYDPASGGNETILGNFFVLNSTQDNSTIRFRYQDDRGNTTSTLFTVYQNNTAICTLLTLNSNNLVSDCPITGYNRSVI